MSDIGDKAFMAKYGDVKVKFSSYYKFAFFFEATLENGDIITVSVGGNSDDIYRFEVIADREETVKELEPYSGTIYRNGEVIESFYNY